MITKTTPSILPMMRRLAGLVGLAALALVSSACTYATRSPVNSAPIDYSDYIYYDRSFAPSPNYGPTAEGAAHPEPAAVEGPARSETATRAGR